MKEEKVKTEEKMKEEVKEEKEEVKTEEEKKKKTERGADDERMSRSPATSFHILVQEVRGSNVGRDVRQFLTFRNNVLRQFSEPLFETEDGGSTYLRTVCIFPPDYTASYPRI